MKLIELRDITKTYHLGEIDVPVLKGVSLDVGRGELVALMGASGSGKSTLMNILGCLDRPTSGRYVLDGQLVSDLSSDQRAAVRNSKIGFVFQSFNLLSRTTALENVMMPLAYSPHVTEKEAKKRAVELLNRVGLGSRMDHYPSQLSGGQQQQPVVDLPPPAELELRLQQELHRPPLHRHGALPVQQVNDHRHGGGEEAEEEGAGEEDHWREAPMAKPQ